MKTALRKDQMSRPGVKSKHTAKTASKGTNKGASKSDLAIALKMFAELQQDMARTKAIMNTSRARSETESSKTSGGSNGISGNGDISGISVNSTGNQNPQISPSYKVSICPVKRPVSSIEMGIPIV